MVKNSYKNKKECIGLISFLIGIMLFFTYIVLAVASSYLDQTPINHLFVMGFALVTVISLGVVAMSSNY